MRHLLPTPSWRTLLLSTLALGVAACGDDTAEPSQDVQPDVLADVSDAGADTLDDVTPDAADTTSDAFDVADAATGRTLGDPVTLAIDEWAAAPSGDGVSLTQLTDSDEVWDGMSVQARPGDWVLTNAHGRFVVEGIDTVRPMSPCPFGGNVIDAHAIDETGRRSEETLGEVCPMINLGQTFRPMAFEVLEDGSSGRAVLRVDGAMDTLDFLNIPAMAGGILGGISLEISLDPARVRPVSISVYYVLTGDARALRVVTAMQNDGEETEHMAVGHLVRPAGEGVFFNPLNSVGGYGYRSIGVDNLEATPMSFIAYTHTDATWAYIPDPDATLNADLPVGAGSVSVTGVTASLFGTFDVLGTLLARRTALGNTDGVITLQPGDSSVIGHHFVVGHDALSDVIDVVYDVLSVETGTMEGMVTDASGAPVADVRVTAVDDLERGMNQAVTDANGRFEMQVPAGVEFTVRAFAPGRVGVAAAPVTVGGGERQTVDVETADPAYLAVEVTDPNGNPVMARVTVTCDENCPRPLSAEADNLVDDLPEQFAALEPVDASGTVLIPLLPGDYGVTVSRGMEWSLWPPNANETSGAPITVVSGETLVVDAEIAHVVDTSGVASGDFHVHAVSSSDSSVGNENRVRQYVANGVDVIVSTDHDYIFDHGPLIEALGLDSQIRSMVGVETTTSSYGHLNGFPLVVDEEHRFGGALDWGNGSDLTLAPDAIFEWFEAFPGEQVVQINHPEDTGYIGGMDADVLLGISRFDGELLGIEPRPVDPITGDTGYWSEDFTAMEVMNGLTRPEFNIRARWWLLMVGRGFSPTATAVTDTHRLYSDIGVAPRSFVFLEGDDSNAGLDHADFVASINAGRVVGSNGPFFEPTLHNEAGDEAGMGETIDNDEGLTLNVRVDVPEWMPVHTVEVYANLVDGMYVRGGRADDSPLVPTLSVPIDLTEDDLVEVATGTEVHRHYVKDVEIPLSFEQDAYVVVMVTGDDANMWPLLSRRSETPRAFSNPIFVDADGGGYDNYPLQPLIDRLTDDKSRSPFTPRPPIDLSQHTHADGETHEVSVSSNAFTREWMGALLERAYCSH